VVADEASRVSSRYRVRDKDWKGSPARTVSHQPDHASWLPISATFVLLHVGLRMRVGIAPPVTIARAAEG
jgi:hypothetical protein